MTQLGLNMLFFGDDDFMFLTPPTFSCQNLYNLSRDKMYIYQTILIYQRQHFNMGFFLR